MLSSSPYLCLHFCWHKSEEIVRNCMFTLMITLNLYLILLCKMKLIDGVRSWNIVEVGLNTIFINNSFSFCGLYVKFFENKTQANTQFGNIYVYVNYLRVATNWHWVSFCVDTINTSYRDLKSDINGVKLSGRASVSIYVYMYWKYLYQMN